MASMEFSGSDVEILVQDYRDSLQAEFDARLAVAGAQVKAEIVKAVAVGEGYANNEVSGKNADERTRAETVYLTTRRDYQQAVEALNEAQRSLAHAEIVRKCAETRVSLVRAWLYSQAGVMNR